LANAPSVSAAEESTSAAIGAFAFNFFRDKFVLAISAPARVLCLEFLRL
jgi:hypothetical protein